MLRNCTDGETHTMVESNARPTPVAAYTETEYLVILPEGEVVARIGQPSPQLDAVLAEQGAERGIFITAWNPASVPHSREANERAHAKLMSCLQERRIRWLPHIGRSPDHQWQEHGVFALDLAEPESLSIAERFGQYAIVTVERGHPPRLILTSLGQAALPEHSPALDRRSGSD
jgi:hypothetical protein